jgi:hypothetical protein
MYGRRGMFTGFWWESQKEKEHLEDLEAGGRIILNEILEKYNVMVWIGFIWVRIGDDGRLL